MTEKQAGRLRRKKTSKAKVNLADAIHRIVAPTGGGRRAGATRAAAETSMTGTASITVRRLDQSVKRKLRMRASADGHSLEEEIRQILSDAAAQPRSTPLNLAQAIMDIVDPVGGIELDLPPRTPEREPPRFDWDEEEP